MPRIDPIPTLRALFCTCMSGPSTPEGAPMLRRFGDYELLEEIARGGMGIVYRARQISLNRIVALKMIRDSHLASPRSIQRFQIEAEAAGKLSHPHIVPIYEFGEHEEQWFLSMRLIEGGDLVRHLGGVPMDARALARLVARLARAVHHAHQHGVLHRDLKPANVLLDAQGEPYITDFGLARFTDGVSHLTLSSDVLGSPNYMAPEQASQKSDDLTTSVDVYSLGAIMYELLTGRAPFRAATPVETLRKVLSEDPIRPRALYKYADRDLETICLKCMEKQPERRYDTAIGLAKDLERWLNVEPILARPTSTLDRVRKWGRRNPLLAGLVAALHLVILAGLMGILLMSYRLAAANRDLAAASDEKERANQRLARNLRDFEWQKAEELAASGRRADALARWAAFLRQNPHDTVAAARIVSMLGANASVLPSSPPLRHGAPVNRLCLSSDEQRLATSANDGKVRIWSLPDGRLLQTLAHPMEPTAVFFAADDRQIITACVDGSVRLWDSNAGTLAYTFPRLAVHPKTDVHLVISPDRRHIACTEGNEGVQVWDIARRERIGPPLATPARLNCAVFSADSRRLAIGLENHEVLVQALGSPAAPLRIVESSAIFALSFQPSGPLLAVGFGGELSLWEPGRENSRRLLYQGGSQVLDAGFSPDGRRLLLSCYDAPLRVFDVVALRQVGAPIPAESRFPYGRISPDGRSLVTRSQNGVGRFWDLETGAPVSEIFEHQGRINAAEFFRDGRSIFTASQDGTAQLWTRQTPPATPVAFPIQDPQPAAVFGPDGRRAFVSVGQHRLNGDGAHFAAIVDTRTGKPVGRAMPCGGQVFRLAVSPDGTRVATGGGRESRIWDAETGDPTTPVLPHREGVNDIAFSPDGKLLASGSSDSTARVWDVATGKRLGAEMPHKDQVMSVRFHPQGRTLVTASVDTTVRLWSVETSQPLWPEPITHAAIVWSAEFSPDGKRLVTASTDRSAVVWDAETRRAVALPMRHQSSVLGAHFSPDGSRVVTFSEDGAARVWDATTGAPVSQPMRHRGRLWSAEFSHDGRQVVSGGDDNAARLWDAATGHPCGEPVAFAGAVTAVAFAPDGRHVLAAARVDALRILPISVAPAPVPPWFPELIEAIAGKRVDEHGDLSHVDRDAIQRFRETALNRKETDFYTRWARWFLEDRSRDPAPAFEPALAAR